MAKDVFYNFTSTLEMARHLSNAKVSSTFAGLNLASQRERRSSDFETATYEDADERLRSGDRQNISKVQKKMQSAVMRGSGTSTRTRSYVDVVGFAPHVPNFVANVPQTMINQKIVRYKNSKVLNIVWNASVDWTVPSEDIMNQSVKVLSEIYSAEKRGYRVNLYVIISTRNKGQYCTSLVKVKGSETYMDLLKVIYPMINPMFLRRHFFKIIETTEGLNKNFVEGYGAPVTDRKEIEKLLPKTFKMDYYFDYYSVSTNGVQIK